MVEIATPTVWEGRWEPLCARYQHSASAIPRKVVNQGFVGISGFGVVWRPFEGVWVGAVSIYLYGTWMITFLGRTGSKIPYVRSATHRLSFCNPVNSSGVRIQINDFITKLYSLLNSSYPPSVCRQGIFPHRGCTEAHSKCRLSCADLDHRESLTDERHIYSQSKLVLHRL